MKNLIKTLLTSFPKRRPPWEIGSNTHIVCVLGREIGLSYDKDTKMVSVHLNHPLCQHWLAIFKPRWDKQNEGKCMTCRGTGWDGIGYTLTCVDCGGTGKLTEKVL